MEDGVNEIPCDNSGVGGQCINAGKTVGEATIRNGISSCTNLVAILKDFSYFTRISSFLISRFVAAGVAGGIVQVGPTVPGTRYCTSTS
jgi:hypothetical protein